MNDFQEIMQIELQGSCISLPHEMMLAILAQRLNCQQDSELRGPDFSRPIIQADAGIDVAVQR
jgi:hypothetical protein